ncbi:ABC transporter permease [Spirochaetia bacterium]|nr:ABC transporter permease [Spirochaetia bacterium]
MKKGNLSDRLTYFGFTLIPLGLYCVFYVFQVLSGIFYSFTNWNGMSPDFSLVGFKNYAFLMRSQNFWRSMGTTFKYALLLVALTITVSLILALCLDSYRRKWVKTLTKAIFFIPAMLSAVTVALIWSQLYYRAIPVIGEALNIGILKTNPLGSPATTLPATVFVNVWQSVAIPTLIFIAGLQSIPRELYESAQMDGAAPLRRFTAITVPYMLPTFVVNLVLLVKGGFTTFDYPYALTGGGPVRATEVIAISIVNDAFQTYRFSLANAEAMVLFVVIALISIVQIKLSQRSSIE